MSDRQAWLASLSEEEFERLQRVVKPPRYGRRDVLKAGGVAAGAAALGAGATGAAMGDASTSDSDGDVGQPTDRVDVFADGASVNTVSAIETFTKSQPVYDPLHPDFGAVADGTTDDSGAIQSAIDQAATNGGGVVSLHSGTFGINADSIALKDGVELASPGFSPLFGGTIVPLTGGTTLIDIPGTAGNAGLRNISVDFAGSGLATDAINQAINISATTDWHIYNIWVNGAGIVTRCLTLNDSAGGTANNIVLENAATDGIRAASGEPRKSLWGNLYLFNNGRAGLLSSARDMVIGNLRTGQNDEALTISGQRLSIGQWSSTLGGVHGANIAGTDIGVAKLQVYRPSDNGVNSGSGLRLDGDRCQVGHLVCVDDRGTEQMDHGVLVLGSAVECEIGPRTITGANNAAIDDNGTRTRWGGTVYLSGSDASAGNYAPQDHGVDIVRTDGTPKYWTVNFDGTLTQIA